MYDSRKLYIRFTTLGSAFNYLSDDKFINITATIYFYAKPRYMCHNVSMLGKASLNTDI